MNTIKRKNQTKMKNKLRERERERERGEKTMHRMEKEISNL